MTYFRSTILFLSWIFFISNSSSNIHAQSLIPEAVVSGHLKDYSKDEKELIEEDLKNIMKLAFRNRSPSGDQRVYVATAGGPGASKSTILETWIHSHANLVYADPDPRALKFMINTYCQSLTYYHISKASSYEELLISAYNKWRGGSNYIACKILNTAFKKGYNIAHGTTSTAKEVEKLYQKLKEKKYKIILLLCGASDNSRLDSIRNRAVIQAFVQNSPEDTLNKGKMFSERFPIYFKYADELHLYWTEDFTKGNVKAASYTKEKGLVIENKEAYEAFKEYYEHERSKNSALKPFESFVSPKKEIQK